MGNSRKMRIVFSSTDWPDVLSLRVAVFLSDPPFDRWLVGLSSDIRKEGVPTLLGEELTGVYLSHVWRSLSHGFCRRCGLFTTRTLCHQCVEEVLA